MESYLKNGCYRFGLIEMKLRVLPFCKPKQYKLCIIKHRTSMCDGLYGIYGHIKDKTHTP